MGIKRNTATWFDSYVSLRGKEFRKLIGDLTGVLARSDPTYFFLGTFGA